MKLTINSTCETKIDADAQGSMMILRTVACRFFLLVVLLLMPVGVKAQAPELSAATERVLYRIQAKNNTAYVIKPNAGNKIDALDSETNSDDSYWFFEDAGKEMLDGNQVQAYYIRNGKTSAYWNYLGGTDAGCIEVSLDNKSKFFIIDNAEKYVIAPTGNSAQYVNPYGGFADGRAIGLWSDKADGNSQWSFVDEKKSKVCAEPVITLSSAAWNWQVTITAEGGCTIYYTTDGTIPTEASSVYDGSFQHDGVSPIRAIAVKNGAKMSSVTSFAERASKPSFQFVEGGSEVEITAASDSKIYYTTDGSEPTSTSLWIDEGGTETLSTDGVTIKAIALTDGKLQSEVLTIEHRTLGVAPQISGNTETYTYRIANTRGNTPSYGNRYYCIYPTDENGTYGKWIKMKEAADELQYWYFLDAGNGYCYIVNRNTGCYLYHNQVEVSSGQDRMELSATQRTKFKIASSTFVDGNIIYHSYNILSASDETLSLNPHGGTGGFICGHGKTDGGSHWFFTDEATITRSESPEITLVGQDISITVPTGCRVYYTTDGSAPTTSSTEYNGVFSHESLEAGKAVSAIATAEGKYCSAVGFKELMATAPPAIMISSDYAKVLLKTIDANSTIYYTTDGSEPTYSSLSGKGAVELSYAECSGKTIKAFAFTDGYLKSAVTVENISGYTEIGSDFDFSAIDVNGHYRLVEDITLSDHAPIGGFVGVFDGGYHKITGLTAPLFASTNDAIIKNVVIEDVEVSASGNVGAIVGAAAGNTRIYNCGVLNGTIDGSSGSNVGSIAGLIIGNARIINCYSFANVNGGATAGGIVGYNSEASTADNLKTLVMNCMYYGSVTGATNCYPIYGGQKISNAGSNGINNYNYYRQEAMTVADDHYNCALAAEEKYLTRFEFYRHVLNSHRELCGFYVKGNVTVYEEIGKWVLDKNVAPYPIVKPWGKYASPVNKAIKDDKVLNTLMVTIDGYGLLQLPITDVDDENHDYNYYKVQLPYYNDLFSNNYTGNRVVTGWKITSVTGGTVGELATSGNNRYNFADRNCTAKDLYSESGRVFAQGGYYNVPEGVTAITIEPYWGKAVYLSDPTYDMVYNTSYVASRFHAAGETPNTFNGQPVYKSLNDVWAQLDNSSSVFDNAIVLCGNFHSYSSDAIWSNGDKGFTLMSVDMNRDNEPDYSLYFKSGVRKNINPVRFDFINHVGIGRAAKVDGTTMMPDVGIFGPKGWFEITETALALYTEFEYQVNDKTLSPLILNGGIYEQFCSAMYGSVLDKTSYIIVGGNCYFDAYTPGCQSGVTTSTAFPPVSILGGEFNEFYLSGVRPDVDPIDDYNALCYGNGGRIGTFAGAYQEQIDGDVIIKLDHMIIDEFYGGGVNDKKPITGNINVTINNSEVGVYCGGPKFGSMSDEKTVTTLATNTTFGAFYGGGYGGTSLYRYKDIDASGQTTYNSTWFANYSNHRGEYNSSKGGILTNYEMEYFNYSGGDNNNARFYTLRASLSVAEVKDINTTLTNCTILGDLYGGGNLGKVNGDITTNLNSCIVKGSVFAGGYSAAVPTCEVMPVAPPTYSVYNGNTGVYTPAVYPTPDTYTWAMAETPLVENSAAIDAEKKEIYTYVIDLTNLGTVTGNTSLTITGSTQIIGSVYGGGNESKVVGDTRVHIKGGNIVGSVYGAGNQASVAGKTAVVIGESDNPEFNYDQIGDKDDIELGAPERNQNR